LSGLPSYEELAAIGMSEADVQEALEWARRAP